MQLLAEPSEVRLTRPATPQKRREVVDGAPVTAAEAEPATVRLAVDMEARCPVVMKRTTHLAIARDGKSGQHFDVTRRVHAQQRVIARAARSAEATVALTWLDTDVDDLVDAIATRGVARNQAYWPRAAVLVAERWRTQDARRVGRTCIGAEQVRKALVGGLDEVDRDRLFEQPVGV